MKKLMLIFLVLSVAGLAVAKEEIAKPYMPFQGDTRAYEAEPNGDCASATVITAGDPMMAAIDPAGDLDYFEFTTAGGCYTFSTYPGDGQVGGDTQMNLLADDCATVVAYNDDGGEGLYSMFQVDLAAGTYFVVINEYGNNGVIGAYVLDIVECPAPPENDTCDGAIVLLDGPNTDEVDLCMAMGDYSPGEYGASCTGYHANGADVVYMVELAPGGSIDACINGSCDLALYLITDCADPQGSCVVGDDSGNPECIMYTSEFGGVYYLIADTYSSCCVITVDAQVNNPVSTDATDWSTIKALY